MKTETFSVESDQHSLRKLATSYWQARVLHVACALNLFGVLETGHKTLQELIEILKADARGIELLVCACASLGLVQKAGERYANSPISSRFLVPGSPEYQGDMIKMYAEDYAVWLHLEEAVRKGGISARKPHFEPGSPEWNRFMDSMYNTGTVTSRILAREISFKPRKVLKLLDVGGGPGAYSIAFAQTYPELRAVVFDLAQVRERALHYIQNAGLEKRISFVAGNYDTDSFPSGMDFVLLSNIFHANSIEKTKFLVRKAYDALAANGFLLVNDFFLNKERTGPEFSALFGVNMLVSTTEGRTYSMNEVSEILQDAGFTNIRFCDLPGTPYQAALAEKS